MGDRPIESERLRLAPLTAADADELHAVLDDPALHRFIGGAPLPLLALRERYARLERGAPEGTGEQWGNWIVRRRADGAAVGVVQATVRGAEADLAWVVGTAWQGQGYASEASRALAASLRAAGVTRLCAHIHPEHAASERVARACGLEPTGVLDADGEQVWDDAGVTPAA